MSPEKCITHVVVEVLTVKLLHELNHAGIWLEEMSSIAK